MPMANRFAGGDLDQLVEQFLVALLDSELAVDVRIASRLLAGTGLSHPAEQVSRLLGFLRPPRKRPDLL